MRIVWLSNTADAPSGYGQQTALAVPRLAAQGHEMAIAANYGHQAAIREWRGFPVFPASQNWGNPVISTFAKHFQADLVIALCDAWVMRPDEWDDELQMAIWAPIDHYPIPPLILAVLQHPKVRPIAMSRDGEQWMRKFGLDPAYVPHAVDTRVFRPHPELKSQARDALSIPEHAFLVGMVAANKGNPAFPRKGWPQALDAFSHFCRKHDDAYLYCHTQARPGPNEGVDLPTLARAVGIPEDRLAFPPEHAWHLGVMDEHFVSSVYQAFDVLLNPSMGEGFGIPILEAQACGVPVIASDHSAMTELVRDTGWLVKGDRWWDALQSSFAIVPSISGIVAALEKAYAARGDEKVREACVRFAEAYDADRVAEEYWRPALEKVSGPPEVPPLNGKVSRQVRRALERKQAKAAA